MTSSNTSTKTDTKLIAAVVLVGLIVVVGIVLVVVGAFNLDPPMPECRGRGFVSL